MATAGPKNNLEEQLAIFRARSASSKPSQTPQSTKTKSVPFVNLFSTPLVRKILSPPFVLCRSFSFQRVKNGPAISGGGVKPLSTIQCQPPGSTLSIRGASGTGNRSGNVGKSSVATGNQPLASSWAAGTGSSGWSSKECVTGGKTDSGVGKQLSQSQDPPPPPPRHSISPPIAMVAPVLASRSHRNTTSGSVSGIYT